MDLIFDTETSDYFQNHLPFSDGRQPYVVQIAGVLQNEDASRSSSFNFIVDNGPIYISPGAEETHKVSYQVISKFGIDAKAVLQMFIRQMLKCECVVGHNIEYDIKVMTSYAHRHGLKDKFLQVLNEKVIIDTMDMADGIMQLPPTEKMIKSGFNKTKPPSLTECMKYFFKEDLSDAHDGFADALATQKLFNHLKTII